MDDTDGRLALYAAALVADWLGDRAANGGAIVSAHNGELPVFIADAADGGRIAIAIAPLWERSADAVADAGRQAMEERLSAGSVRGPYIIWVPPRGAVPADEPKASDFVMRVQLAAAPMLPGSRNEIDLPVKIQLAKMREEGGYASVIGGLGRFWTLITERVTGTFHVNSAALRRAPQSEAARTALFDQIGELSKPLGVGDAIEFDASEAWTVQRLQAEPMGEGGFAIAQAPPKIDPADGTLMRRLVRRRLKDAAAALDGVEAATKGVGLIAIYEYAEHENVGSFVKSLDPGLYSRFQFAAAIVDGEVRPIFAPR